MYQKMSAASESVSENTASVSTASGSSSYSVSKMSFGANEKDVILCTASLSEETGNEDAADDSGQKEQLRISIVGEGDCTQTEMVIAAPVTGAVPQRQRRDTVLIPTVLKRLKQVFCPALLFPMIRKP